VGPSRGRKKKVRGISASEKMRKGEKKGRRGEGSIGALISRKKKGGYYFEIFVHGEKTVM